MPSRIPRAESPRPRRHAQLVWVLCASALCTACPGSELECGSGTHEDDDGVCVPDTATSCGSGTHLADGACVPDSTLACGMGTHLSGGACVPDSLLTCGTGTHEASGQCVPDTGLMCGTGTHEDAGLCVPNASPLACGTGTHEVNGECVPTSMLACGAGTHETNGTCVPDASPLSCGPGTQASNGQCVPTAIPTTCGPGTVTSDGGVCVPAPAATLTRVRLTTLKLDYNIAKPAFMNNAIAVRFGLTANSANDAAPVTAKVNVVFSFVEPVPADPANPKSCDSNGFDLSVVGDGSEHFFERDIFPTDQCAALVGTGATVNLAVDFDKGLKAANTPTGIDYPAVRLTAADQSNALNQLCKKSASDATPGCVYAVQVQPTPMGMDGKALVDISLDTLAPESAVGLVWPTAEDPDVPMGMAEPNKPSIVVQAGLVMEGRNPYARKAKFTPEQAAANPALVEQAKLGLSDMELEALDDLPGTGATMRYEIRPSEAAPSEAWMTLAIDDPANPNPDGHVTELAIPAIEPGAVLTFTHDLFIEGDVLAAVSTGGTWAAQDEYQVRGCLVAGFPEGGNEGDDEDGPSEDIPSGSCKSFRVRLVRVVPPGGLAGSHTFDQTWTKSVGSADRAALTGTLRTTNALSLSGATSDNEGFAELSGNVGGPFSIKLFRAFGKAGALTALATSYIDLGVEVFGLSLWGYQNTAADFTYTIPVMYAKAFQFPGLGWSYGAVSVGITFGIGGNVGLSPTFTINAATGGNANVPELAMATSNGTLSVGIRPEIGLTANITGGIDIFIAAAQVVATLQVINLGFPVAANMRWGVTGLNGEAVSQVTVIGDITWDLTIDWMNISVDLVGRILIFPATVNIFTYTNPRETVNLLTRRLPGVLVLQ